MEKLLGGCTKINGRMDLPALIQKNPEETPYSCETRAYRDPYSSREEDSMKEQVRAMIESLKNTPVEEPAGYFLEKTVQDTLSWSDRRLRQPDQRYVVFFCNFGVGSVEINFIVRREAFRTV